MRKRLKKESKGESEEAQTYNQGDSTQNYLGVKRVEAEPCEKDGKDGYRIIYPDGYESWSPKKVFESTYFPIDKANSLSADDIDRFISIRVSEYRH